MAAFGDGELGSARMIVMAAGRYLPPFPPPAVAQFGGVLAARRAEEEECGYAIWAVQDKMTGAFLGQCGLRRISQAPEAETEIAYHYLRSAWNKGYGTEAAIAVLAHGLGPVGLHRVIAVAMPQNTGSWRVMEKAGMRYEGMAAYFELTDLKKYAAERTWWHGPPTPASRVSAWRVAGDAGGSAE